MKEMTMGTDSKRKTLKKRNKASYKNLKVHSDKLSVKKIGGQERGVMPSGDSGDRESPADREYRRMLGDKIYRGASGSAPSHNQTKRRNK